MNRSIVMFALLASGFCAPSYPLTATVQAVATQNASVGGAAELLVNVTNTGPAISHLGLVFRTPDRWYERHEMTSFSTLQKVAVDCLPRRQGSHYRSPGLPTRLSNPRGGATSLLISHSATKSRARSSDLQSW